MTTAKRRLILKCALLAILLPALFLVSASIPSADSKPPVKMPETAPQDSGNGVSRSAKEVFRLLVETSDGTVLGGTAFLVSGKRIVATNHHVIENGAVFFIGLVDDSGYGKSVPARLMASFPQKDLALLEALDDLPGDPLPLAGQYPKLADELFAIGFPAAADMHEGISQASSYDAMFFTPSVLKGYVSRILSNRWFRNQLQHQTPIIPGYSGGPLINPAGTVLGISSSIHKEASGISYGVLAADLIDLLEACALPAKILSRSPHSRQTVVARPEPARKEDRQVENAANPITVKVSDELITRAYRLLKNGEITAARLMFEYLAYNLPTAEIYVGLAKTYDPDYLKMEGILGAPGDTGKAQYYYAEATRLLEGKDDIVPETFGLSRTRVCMNSHCELVSGPSGIAVACENSAAR